MLFALVSVQLSVLGSHALTAFKITSWVSIGIGIHSMFLVPFSPFLSSLYMFLPSFAGSAVAAGTSIQSGSTAAAAAATTTATTVVFWV
jgi:hypothetical protein